MLRYLPPDLKVVDCANCRRLTTTDSGAGSRFRGTGLQTWGRRLYGKQQGQVLCQGCAEGWRPSNDPNDYRTRGQLAKLREAFYHE
jgi:hypothetical protein